MLKESLNLKIRDNKAVIANIINKQRLKANYNAKLIMDKEIDRMVTNIMLTDGVSEYLATERLKKMVKDGKIK